MSPIEHRVKSVAEEIERIMKDVGSKMVRLHHLRAELRLLLEEVTETAAEEENEQGNP